MCGIVGYVGDKSAVGIIVDGLKKLEYRGYDSAGVAILQDGRLEVRRAPGKMKNLEAVLKLSVLDIEQIRKRRFSVALDAVRGAGGPVMRTLLERLGCRVAGINLETDGRFPRAPEPIPENLGELAALVRRSGADVTDVWLSTISHLPARFSSIRVVWPKAPEGAPSTWPFTSWRRDVPRWC